MGNLAHNNHDKVKTPQCRLNKKNKIEVTEAETNFHLVSCSPQTGNSSRKNFAYYIVP